MHSTARPPPLGAGSIVGYTGAGRPIFQREGRADMLPHPPRQTQPSAPQAPAHFAPEVAATAPIALRALPASAGSLLRPAAKRPSPAPSTATTTAADANIGTAATLGIVDALTSTHIADEWTAEPSAAERQQAVRLRLALSNRAAVANAPTYHADLAYALSWVVHFAATMPNRKLLVRNLDVGDSMYNADTRGMLFEHIRETGSRRGGPSHGKVLKSDTISGILSTFFAFCERLAGGALSNPGALAMLSQARKQARHEDGPAGERAVAAPLRALHMRAAFISPGFDTSSPGGVVRQAGILFGHNVLARAQCLSGGEHDAVDPSRDLTIASFDWLAAAAMIPPAVVVWLHPSKDPTQRKRRYPMLVQRRSVTAPLGSDPMCTFDALRMAWHYLAESIPRAQWASTLFFRVAIELGDDPRIWRPLRPLDVTVWVCAVAEAAGLPPGSRGSRALRMGGASDMYDIWGPAAERFIRERGRWGSDVAQIYQRVSAAAHGDISRTIGDSVGADLQSMLTGWCQTAVSHGRCPV